MVKLHHTGPIPDWEKIDPRDWSSWQRIASKTWGVVTPGNAVSVLGLALVLWGLADIVDGNTASGLFKLAAGRIMDLLDGAVAHKTATKSPIGEGTDASVDKLELAIGLPVLIWTGLLPFLVGFAIALQNIANVVLALIAKRRKYEMHPSKFGKVGMAFQWGAMGLYLLSAVALEGNSDSAPQLLQILAYILAVVSLAFGAVATYGYAQGALVKSSISANT